MSSYFSNTRHGLAFHLPRSYRQLKPAGRRQGTPKRVKEHSKTKMQQVLIHNKRADSPLDNLMILFDNLAVGARSANWGEESIKKLIIKNHQTTAI